VQKVGTVLEGNGKGGEKKNVSLNELTGSTWQVQASIESKQQFDARCCHMGLGTVIKHPATDRHL